MKEISQNKKNDALAAIEAATGKINIVLARNAKAALIPVASEVEVIDAAPLDEKVVQALDHGVAEAVKSKNYPTARLLLYSLESEIRTRTYNLPLAAYPLALKRRHDYSIKERTMTQVRYWERRSIPWLLLTPLRRSLLCLLAPPSQPRKNSGRKTRTRRRHCWRRQRISFIAARN